jgi:transmembrane E3 ubiquitin-protein ligase
LALTENHFTAFRTHVYNTTYTTLHKHPDAFHSNLEPPAEETDYPLCELVIYLQQYPLDLALVESFGVDGIEKELHSPMGLKKLHAPELKMSMIAFSPDCGYVLESDGPPLYMPRQSDHLRGLKSEVWLSRTSYHLLGLGAVLWMHLLLSRRQVAEANTPSRKNRISAVTLNIITTVDGVVGVTLAIFVVMTETLYKSFAFAFAASAMTLFVGLNFLAAVESVHYQDRERERRQNQALSNSHRTTNPYNADPPRYYDTGSVLIMSADQANLVPSPDGNREDSSVSRRGWVYKRTTLLFVILFFIGTWTKNRNPDHELFSHNLSLAKRDFLDFTSLLISLSLWIPQIYRNAIRNCDKAFKWEYVLGQSFLRLTPAAYIYIYSNNVFDHPSEPLKFYFLTGWILAQLSLLSIQFVLGPRWGIPSSWLPHAYDYHPILREDDETSRIILGYTEKQSSTHSGRAWPVARERKPSEIKVDKHRRAFDCAICMQAVHVPVAPASFHDTKNDNDKRGGGATSILLLSSRRSYMITPCRHVFHTKCLEAAMRYRLQCPICREGLPAL